MKTIVYLSYLLLGYQAVLADTIVEFSSSPTILLDYVPTPGNPGLFPTPTAPATIDSAAGLSMNVVFTPNGNDINQIITKSRNLAEIGGSGSGTGLYLNGGEIYFLSKVGGSGADVATFNDLDFSVGGTNLVAYKSTFGKLTAGTEYSIGLIYDPNKTAPKLTLGILPTGGSLSVETLNFTGFETLGTNWFGNRTVSSFVNPGNGGGGTSTAGNPFFDGAGGASNILALNGTKGPVTVWNSVGTLIGLPGPPDKIRLTITPNSSTPGNYDFKWESKAGMTYDLVSSTDFDTAPETWPIWDGRADIAGTTPENQLTDIPGGSDSNRFFAVIEKELQPLLEEDFESDNGGFTSTFASGTDWVWGAPTSGSAGSTNPGGFVTSGNAGSINCWGTNIGNPGFYADPTTNSYLRSPNLDLTGIAGAELTFAEAIDVEAGDTAVLQLINATDDTWIADVYTVTDLATDSANWANANGGVPIDLSAGAGLTVYLQWCLSGTGGDSNDYMGWYIDDVVVTESNPIND